MGTRSVIAVPYRTKTGWRGRYCHWDGYPSGVGQSLFQIVRRDGIKQARKTLTSTWCGWSQINPEQKEDDLSPGYDDGRFAAVEGYGVAFTTTKLDIFGEKAYQQARRGDWIRFDGDDDAGTEWAYVLDDDRMWVHRRIHHDGTPAIGMFGLPAAEGGRWYTAAVVKYQDSWPEFGPETMWIAKKRGHADV